MPQWVKAKQKKKKHKRFLCWCCLCLFQSGTVDIFIFGKKELGGSDRAAVTWIAGVETETKTISTWKKAANEVRTRRVRSWNEFRRSGCMYVKGSLISRISKRWIRLKKTTHKIDCRRPRGITAEPCWNQRRSLHALNCLCLSCVF